MEHDSASAAASALPLRPEKRESVGSARERCSQGKRQNGGVWGVAAAQSVRGTSSWPHPGLTSQIGAPMDPPSRPPKPGQDPSCWHSASPSPSSVTQMPNVPVADPPALSHSPQVRTLFPCYVPQTAPLFLSLVLHACASSISLFIRRARCPYFLFFSLLFFAFSSRDDVSLVASDVSPARVPRFSRFLLTVFG